MSEYKSSVESIMVASAALANNPLNDPSTRHVMVYLPAAYFADSETKFPVLMALAGFGGSGEGFFNFDPMSENIQQRMDRLIRDGVTKPAIIVAPNCFTRVGGCQYLNSSAVGMYEDFLVKDLIPYINQNYRTTNWGVFGKSSGGFGAWHLACKNPEVFQAAANHSGDGAFELCYIPDFSAALDGFRRAGGPKAWFDTFWADKSQKRKKYFKTLNVLGMSAHYSPNPESKHMGIDFPFCLQTGRFKYDVWEKWQAWDPINLAERYADNLKKLKCLFIDCGGQDEFSLHWAARSLSEKLSDLGVDHSLEEFDDGHMNITYRYDRSIPKLVRSLS
jgi:enterochelin esterase-like enzyme